jgi:hypothetical protein
MCGHVAARDSALPPLSHPRVVVPYHALAHHRRLIFVTVYFQGSYYLKVQDSQTKTHHLLDASFPSFNNKARGLTLTCSWKPQFENSDFHFREMCVWEQVVRAVPVDFAAELKKAAEKRARRLEGGGSPRKKKVCTWVALRLVLTHASLLASAPRELVVAVGRSPCSCSSAHHCTLGGVLFLSCVRAFPACVLSSARCARAGASCGSQPYLANIMH